MAAPTEYVAEGDGFDVEFEPQDPIIRAAAIGDIPEVRRQLSLGDSLAGAMYHCLQDEGNWSLVDCSELGALKAKVSSPNARRDRSGSLPVTTDAGSQRRRTQASATPGEMSNRAIRSKIRLAADRRTFPRDHCTLRTMQESQGSDSGGIHGPA